VTDVRPRAAAGLLDKSNHLHKRQVFGFEGDDANSGFGSSSVGQGPATTDSSAS
jgi:hypothetical protein